MLLACFLPLLPAVISNDTFWPSLSVLNPAMLMAEKWAKRSSPPPSGVMKPKPFASLNHLTVPVAICNVPYLKLNRGSFPHRVGSQTSVERTNSAFDQPSIRKRTATGGLYAYMRWGSIGLYGNRICDL